MESSRLLLKPLFWVAFTAVVVTALYLYGNSLARDLTELELTKRALAGAEQQRDAIARELTVCNANAAMSSARIARLTAQVDLLTNQNRELQEAMASPKTPETPCSSLPEMGGVPQEQQESGGKRQGPARADEPRKVRGDDAVEVESLAEIRVLIVWTADRGREARQLQGLLELRGAIVSFELASSREKRQSAIYAPVALRERAERVARVTRAIRVLPLMNGGTHQGVIEIYLSTPTEI